MYPSKQTTVKEVTFSVEFFCLSVLHRVVQEKQEILMFIFPDRENIGNLTKSMFFTGNLP